MNKRVCIEIAPKEFSLRLLFFFPSSAPFCSFLSLFLFVSYFERCRHTHTHAHAHAQKNTQRFLPHLWRLELFTCFYFSSQLIFAHSLAHSIFFPSRSPPPPSWTNLFIFRFFFWLSRSFGLLLFVAM